MHPQSHPPTFPTPVELGPAVGDPWLHLRVLSETFRYLWLKHVRAFDPEIHCARSLVGDFDQQLVPFRKQKSSIKVDAPFVPRPGYLFAYLCGVAATRDRNVHLALRPRTGIQTLARTEDIFVLVTGWEAVAIEPLPEAVAHRLPRNFSTCRNYQFGFHHLPVEKHLPAPPSLFGSDEPEDAPLDPRLARVLRDWNGDARPGPDWSGVTL